MLDDIKLAIKRGKELGNLNGAVKLLKAMYLKLDKDKWTDTKQKEYESEGREESFKEWLEKEVVVKEATELEPEVKEKVHVYKEPSENELSELVENNKLLIDARNELRRTQRQELLDSGKVFSFSFGTFWLNEYWAMMFMTKLNTVMTLGRENILWKDIEKNRVELSIDEAKEIAESLLDILDFVYFEMEVK